MKEVVDPREADSVRASLFSQGLIELMTKLEARERPANVKGCEIRDVIALTQAHDVRR